MPYATTSPKAFTGVHSASYYGIYRLPIGSTGGLVQCWRRGSDFLVPQWITANGVRRFSSYSAPPAAITLEITMSNTPVTFATFSATFAQNLGQSVVVFARKTVNLPAGQVPDLDVPWAWFVHDLPFVFLGPHLVVQFDLGSAVNAQNTSRYAPLIPASEVGHFDTTPSCGAGLSASGSGTAYVLTFHSGAASTSGVLLLGTENVLWNGSRQLPLRLDAFGLTPIQSRPCLLGIAPLAAVGFQVDTTGRKTWTVPLNYTASSESDVIYAQVVHTAAGNPAGLATSNVSHSVLGASGLANDIANLTRDGPVAEYGPSAFNRGPVLLFRP